MLSPIKPHTQRLPPPLQGPHWPRMELPQLRGGQRHLRPCSYVPRPGKPHRTPGLKILFQSPDPKLTARCWQLSPLPRHREKAKLLIVTAVSNDRKGNKAPGIARLTPLQAAPPGEDTPVPQLGGPSQETLALPMGSPRQKKEEP